MSVNASLMSINDLQQAMSLAKEAAFIWFPETDTLEWTEQPFCVCDDTLVGCGSAWRKELAGDDVERRDSWMSSSDQCVEFVGKYRLGDAAEAKWIEERLVRPALKN